MTRDEGRCRVPGCRAARNLDVHHLVHRAHGGGNGTSNLAVLCSGHHRLLHEGLITPTGNADRGLTFARDGKILVDTRVIAAASGTASIAPASIAPASPIVDGTRTMERTSLASSRASAPAGVTGSQAPTALNAASRHAPSRYAEVERRTLATAALQQAGFKVAIAKRAVSIAEMQIPPGADLEPLIREALRHCG